jgi:undecaprenyl-diphosphatase
VITYFQAIVIGLLQGVTELFPISSLGHSVLIPALFGWDGLVQGQSAGESFYLAFLVGLHVATALALLVFFRHDWNRVIRGFGRTLQHRHIPEGDTDARMAWLLIIGTIPVGAVGLVFEHSLRTIFAKPTAAAIFLIINGLILLGGEQVRKRSGAHAEAGRAPRRALTTFTPVDALIVGGSEVLALFAGISRSGVTMVAGLLRGLTHEDAVRFSFMLATPVILAAGVYKLPDLVGPNGQGVRGQILIGSIAAGLAAYAAVRFLVRWFETRTLTPFGIYCVAFGTFCLIRFA